MVYLPPSDVLDRLSEFTADTLVGAIGNGSKFQRAQAGSMSSTLGFLARETEHREQSFLEQRVALLEALDELEGLGDDDATSFVTAQRDLVDSEEPTMGNADDVQATLLEAIGGLQSAMADGTFGEDTTRARAVLYELLEKRVQSQLQVVGRDA